MSEVLPEPHTLHANGLNFSLLEIGNGPLVLILHGFPDTPYSFWPIMQKLADAGYRAVAPFTRGYAPTELAPDGDYSIPTLGRDVIALIEHLAGGEKATVIGHDWGSVMAQYAANLRPDRFEKLVLAGFPLLKRFMVRMGPAQMRRSHYIFKFQARYWPERRLPKNDFEWVENELIRKWAPGWDFSEEDIEPIKAILRNPECLRALLGYYRAIPGKMLASPTARKIGFRPIQVPGMMIFGSEDGCIGPELFVNSEKGYAADLRLVEAKGMGHFMHCEDPQWFTDRVIEFLHG